MQAQAGSAGGKAWGRRRRGPLQGYYTKASKWQPWQEEAEAVRAYQHRLKHNEVACEWGPGSWAPALFWPKQSPFAGRNGCCWGKLTYGDTCSDGRGKALEGPGTHQMTN